MSPALEIHLILANASTHKTQLIQRWLKKRPCYQVHFTPTSSSWLNLVERVLSELTTKQLPRGVYWSVKALEAAIYTFLAERNQNPKPFVWTKTADEILENVRRFCQRTSAPGH